MTYPLEFKDGSIEGVIIKDLKRFQDARGWLAELYREDELAEEFHPVMSYISETLPGVKRGPHEHREQADYFCFIGPSDFELMLWDNRSSSKTFGNRIRVVLGESRPAAALVPKGVVHAYRNVGSKPGWVFNAANQLYRGAGKKEAVDEMRHEDDPASPFQF